MTVEKKESKQEDDAQATESLTLKELTIFDLCALGSPPELKQKLEEAPSGFDINALDEDGFSLLMIAAKLNHLDLTALLLEEGADVNVKGARDLTALMVASQHANIPSVQLLLEEERHVDLEATDSSGNTALMYAAMCGSVQIAEMLIEKEVDLNVKNQNLGTALSLGVLYGKENVVEFLLKTGADANASDSHGNTALHYAATLGYVNVLKLLLSNGGKTNIQNEQKMIPEELADQPNIVQLLQSEQ